MKHVWGYTLLSYTELIFVERRLRSIMVVLRTWYLQIIRRITLKYA